MHIHTAVNYVIVSYVIVNDVIGHRCRLVMESDSDTAFWPFIVIGSPISYMYSLN